MYAKMQKTFCAGMSGVRPVCRCRLELGLQYPWRNLPIASALLAHNLLANGVRGARPEPRQARCGAERKHSDECSAHPAGGRARPGPDHEMAEEDFSKTGPRPQVQKALAGNFTDAPETPAPKSLTSLLKHSRRQRACRECLKTSPKPRPQDALTGFFQDRPEAPGPNGLGRGFHKRPRGPSPEKSHGFVQTFPAPKSLSGILKDLPEAPAAKCLDRIFPRQPGGSKRLTCLFRAPEALCSRAQVTSASHDTFRVSSLRQGRPSFLKIGGGSSDSAGLGSLWMTQLVCPISVSTRLWKPK